MNRCKKDRIRKLYELERMVYSKPSNTEEIERLRVELKCKDFEVFKGKPKGAKKFNVDEYIKAKEQFPDLTDNEIALMLDVSPQTIARVKSKNGLCKKQNTSEERFKRMQQVMDMIKSKPNMSKSEIAKLFGVSSNCIKKDLRDYEEWSKRYGKAD